MIVNPLYIVLTKLASSSLAALCIGLATVIVLLSSRSTSNELLAVERSPAELSRRQSHFLGGFRFEKIRLDFDCF